MNTATRFIAHAAMLLISGAALAGNIDTDTSAAQIGYLAGSPYSWQQSYLAKLNGILDGMALYGNGIGTLTVHVDNAAEPNGYYSGHWDATLGHVALDGSVIDLSAYKLNVHAGQKVTFEISDNISINSSLGSVGAMYINRHNALGTGEDYTWLGESIAFTSYVAAVPEPAAYGMLLAGLGLLAVAARRRRA